MDTMWQEYGIEELEKGNAEAVPDLFSNLC